MITVLVVVMALYLLLVVAGTILAFAVPSLLPREARSGEGQGERNANCDAEMRRRTAGRSRQEQPGSDPV